MKNKYGIEGLEWMKDAEYVYDIRPKPLKI